MYQSAVEMTIVSLEPSASVFLATLSPSSAFRNSMW